MLTFYPHKGLVDDPFPTWPGRVMRATREEIGKGGMPTPRRYGIVMGWLDPTTMTPLIAACNDHPLSHAISAARATDIENWRRPEVLGPLIAKCRDPELRRALELALLRANAGQDRRATGAVEDGRKEV